MQVPLELSFRGVDQTDAIETYVRQQIRRLERFYDRIVACRVAIEKPQQHQGAGSAYRVRVELSIPQAQELVVSKEPGQEPQHRDLHGVIGDAFAALERQLKRAVAKQRYEVKTHDEPRAMVVRVFPEQNYGFIRAIDGVEYYFHRNGVLHGDFDRISVGTEVRFEPQLGAEGPQASSVQVLGRPGVRAGKASS